MQLFTTTFLIVSIMLLLACKQKPISPNPIPSWAKQVNVTLEDSVGSVTLYIPQYLDTFLAWKDDFGCSDRGYHAFRFQNKRLPLFMESGFYTITPPIAIDQLTIYQSDFKRSGNDDSAAVRMSLFVLRDHMRAGTNNQIVTDTFCNINHRYFGIVASYGIDVFTKKHTVNLTAITKIHSNTLSFEYVRNSDNPFNAHPYVDSLLPLLQTIQVNLHKIAYSG